MRRHVGPTATETTPSQVGGAPDWLPQPGWAECSCWGNSKGEKEQHWEAIMPWCSSEAGSQGQAPEASAKPCVIPSHLAQHSPWSFQALCHHCVQVNAGSQRPQELFQEWTKVLRYATVSPWWPWPDSFRLKELVWPRWHDVSIEVTHFSLSIFCSIAGEDKFP